MLPSQLSLTPKWNYILNFAKIGELDESELENEPEASQTVAYTRFVLEEGLRGDILDLKVALSPCVIGYGEIGRKLNSSLDNSTTNEISLLD